MNLGLVRRVSARGVILGVLMLIAIAMMIYGIQRGEMRTVEKKATRICLECIGIG